MSVIHTKKLTENFTICNNDVIRDPTLSRTALGWWLTCISRPDDWNFHVTELMKTYGDSRHSVLKGLNELIDKGYCIRVQKTTVREVNGIKRATFSSVDYMIFDRKISKEEADKYKDEFKKMFAQCVFEQAQTELPLNRKLPSTNCHEECNFTQNSSSSSPRKPQPYKDKSSKKWKKDEEEREEENFYSSSEEEEEVLRRYMSFIEKEKLRNKPISSPKAVKTTIRDNLRDELKDKKKFENLNGLNSLEDEKRIIKNLEENEQFLEKHFEQLKSHNENAIPGLEIYLEDNFLFMVYQSQKYSIDFGEDEFLHKIDQRMELLYNMHNMATMYSTL
jgi:hypothetical protein